MPATPTTRTVRGCPRRSARPRSSSPTPRSPRRRSEPRWWSTTRTRHGWKWPPSTRRSPTGSVDVGSNGSSARPIIGVTAYGEHARYGVWDHEAVLLPRTYPDVVIAAGGVPVLLPPVPESAAAVDRLDAVVLAGGPDVDPDRYGAAPHPRTGEPRPERDAAELAVLHQALERGIPVLGVCRGAQILNVGLGGTLVQHVPDAVGHSGHNPSPGVFGTIQVTLEAGSRVAAALGPETTVRCHHHQALRRLADGRL